MKTFSPAFAAHLASGVTTLAWCWRLERRDGVSVGFTDHDRDLSFGGVTYEAASGFSASEIRDTLGLAVDNLDVQSAISSVHLDEGDLAAGLYDDARVEIWRVNWADVSQRALMRRGSLGEITRAGASFSAEVRGLAHYLNQPDGRAYQYTCDAALGDARCGVDVTSPAWRATAVIDAVLDARTFTALGLESYPDDHFTFGRAELATAGTLRQTIEIHRHTLTSALTTIALWQAPARALLVGDTLTLTAGCDKHFATCRDRFSNAARFRGFPHMPGNAFVVAVARADAANDGQALR